MKLNLIAIATISIVFNLFAITQECQQSDYNMIITSADTLDVALDKLENICMTVNMMDSLGRKAGPWVSVEEPIMKDVMFVDSSGKKIRSWLDMPVITLRFHYDSIESTYISFRKYDSNNIVVSTQDTWINGKARGPIIYYHSNGLISGLVNSLMPNKDFIGVQRIYSKEAFLPYQGYCYDFYEDGSIKSEGWVIFAEDYISDSEDVGIWKFYSPDGKVRIVDYSKKEPLNNDMILNDTIATADTLDVGLGKLGNNCLTVNKTDSLGRKAGPWVSVEEPIMKDVMFVDSSGKKIRSWLDLPVINLRFYCDSIESTYISFHKYDSKNVVVSFQNTLINGKARGPLIMYYPNGLISGIVNRFFPNKDFIGAQRTYFKDVVFPYQGYCYNFYEDGNIEAEGWMIFTENYLIDCEEVGIWKYYNPDGKIRIVDYSKKDVNQ